MWFVAGSRWCGLQMRASPTEPTGVGVERGPVVEALAWRRLRVWCGVVRIWAGSGGADLMMRAPCRGAGQSVGSELLPE